MALGLATEGCDLALCAREAEGLAKTAGEIEDRYGVKVWSKPADLSQSGAGGAFIEEAIAALGVTVNNVLPGYIHTERVEAILNHRAQSQGISRDEALAAVVKDIPLGRLGRPEEFADLVVFLASERASYITGASYWIDGGLFSGLL